MWSVGCILGELLGGRPLFPGTSAMNQLDRVIEITGRPSQEDIASIDSVYAATMIENLPRTQPCRLQERFPYAPDAALDLLRQLLQFNPHKRITAKDALHHPFVAAFNTGQEEITCGKAIKISIDDNCKHSILEYRNVLYQEIFGKKKEKLQPNRSDHGETEKKRKRKKKREDHETNDGEKKNRKKTKESPKNSDARDGEKKGRKIAKKKEDNITV